MKNNKLLNFQKSNLMIKSLDSLLDLADDTLSPAIYDDVSDKMEYYSEVLDAKHYDIAVKAAVIDGLQKEAELEAEKHHYSKNELMLKSDNCLERTIEDLFGCFSCSHMLKVIWLEKLYGMSKHEALATMVMQCLNGEITFDMGEF